VSLRTVPVSFKQAGQFVAAWHRHHRPPRGHKFSIGVAADDVLVGVAIVGRPVARHLDDGQTLTATTDIRTCGMPLRARVICGRWVWPASAVRHGCHGTTRVKPMAA
jgi:hypothetical protein